MPFRRPNRGYCKNMTGCSQTDHAAEKRDLVTGGASGIIVDSNRTSGQAPSIYLSSLSSVSTCAGGAAVCAYKMTHRGLQ